VGASGNVVSGGDDGVGQVIVDHAELRVRPRAGRLDLRQRLDVGRLQRGARDGEVLHRPLRLGSPQCVLGHAYLAHGVVLDAEVVSAHGARRYKRGAE
jgi:hypothetical protein